MRMFILLIPFVLQLSLSNAQSESMVIEGDVTIGYYNTATPDEGTLRMRGQSLEGYNGSEWVSLTGLGVLSDVDGNKYQTVAIGNQVWMAENLKTTKFSDGTDIPMVWNSAEWSTTDQPAYALYNNDPENDVVRGKLYNYYTVDSDKNICPVGWKVPDDSDYNQLMDYLGDGPDIGMKLKEVGEIHWKPSSVSGIDEVGFQARGGGYRTALGTYVNLLENGVFWYRSDFSDTLARVFAIVSFSANVIITDFDKSNGHSIRCLKTVLSGA